MVFRVFGVFRNKVNAVFVGKRGNGNFVKLAVVVIGYGANGKEGASRGNAFRRLAAVAVGVIRDGIIVGNEILRLKLADKLGFAAADKTVGADSEFQSETFVIADIAVVGENFRKRRLGFRHSGGIIISQRRGGFPVADVENKNSRADESRNFVRGKHVNRIVRQRGKRFTVKPDRVNGASAFRFRFAYERIAQPCRERVGKLIGKVAEGFPIRTEINTEQRGGQFIRVKQ